MGKTMRVIAGTARGVPIEQVPGATTRASLGRVRQSLFSILTPYLEDARVLDLFAGTGSLGIEALSRGARSAVFIDANPRSIETVRRNVARAGLADTAEIMQNDALNVFRSHALGSRPFDIVFIDPPYALLRDEAAKRAFIRMLGDAVASGNVKKGGQLVIKHEAGILADVQTAGLDIQTVRRYRHAEVSIFILPRGPAGPGRNRPAKKALK